VLRLSEAPQDVRRAVSATAWLRDVPAERIAVEELRQDWIVYVTSPALVAGGLRLVVPKGRHRSFSIESACAADDDSGISTDYDVLVRSCSTPAIDAARILADGTGARKIDAMTALKAPPSHLGRFYLHSPLELRRELWKRGVKVDLIRPDHCGGYIEEEEAKGP
jgi:hypothetical protein